jgi:hypothetical protein
LQQLAGAGAIQLVAHLSSSRMIEISHSLADEFLLPHNACVVSDDHAAVTAGEICDSVCAAIRELESRGEMPIGPADVDHATKVVGPFARNATIKLRLTTDLNEAVPMGARRRLWQAANEQRARLLPPFGLPKWATGVAFAASLAITFGTTIPLAQWLDREHPVDESNGLMRIVAMIIVRGGFFLLLIVSAAAAALVLWRFFPQFPPTCRTVGHLAAYLRRDEARANRDRWSKELVWPEVRRIVACAIGVDETQVRPTTRCGATTDTVS